MVRRRAGEEYRVVVDTGGGGGDEENVVLLREDLSKTTTEKRKFYKVACACILSCLLGYAIGHSSSSSWDFTAIHHAAKEMKAALIGSSKDDPCSELVKKGVPAFRTREDLGDILQQENMTIGVELGVQQGHYSRNILKRWPSCKEYHLVDLWAQQENYKDAANVDQTEQDANYQKALGMTNEWKDKIHVCRNYTSECVKKVLDAHFDFIFIDARHDFKGVYEDLVNWWPKLRKGGIFAGHDYVTQDEVSASKQDWTLNYDGTKDETGTVVKGAVDKFAESVCRQVSVSYREAMWNTWALRK